MAEFPNTRLSRIEAGDVTAFYEAYCDPIYAFLRQKGHRKEDAEDITHGFLASLAPEGIEQWMQKHDPKRGRFRTWVIGSVTKYRSSLHKRDMAQKRGSGMEHLPLDVPGVESTLESLDPDPSVAYDQMWAIKFDEGVMADLQENYERRGKTHEFETLKPFIDTAHERRDDEKLAVVLGTNKDNVRLLVHRLRKKRLALLREETARTMNLEEQPWSKRPEEEQEEIKQELREIILRMPSQ